MDQIRQWIIQHEMTPRIALGLEFTLRAGDLHDAMHLHAQMPMVCNAMKQMPAHCQVRIVQIVGPRGVVGIDVGPGANYFVTYVVLDAH